jgi:hypothetical protein
MKILISKDYCTMNEYGTDNFYLTEYPKGNKYKYMGKWYYFQEKYFSNHFVMIFTAKDGKQLIFRSIEKNDTLEEI